MKKISLVLIMSLSALFANSVAVTAADDTGGNVTFTVSYDFTDAVAGYQFDVLTDGVLTITGAEPVATACLNTDGEVEDCDIAINASATTLLGFSFSGVTIAPGQGDLLTFTGSYTADAGTEVVVEAKEDCASDCEYDADGECTNCPSCANCNGDMDTRLVLSDPSGDALDADWHEAVWTVGTSFSDGSTLNDLTDVYSYDLSDNYPNPFNPTTQINYAVELSGDVNIVVYDMMGREVKTLVSEYATPGNYSVVWDSKNNEGVNVAAGIYMYKMVSGDFVKVNKMMLVK